MKKRTGVGIFVTFILAVLALYPGCASAKFELSNMIVSPNPVGAGDEAIITVDVTNVGNAAGDYIATLKVGDDTMDAEAISLEPGVTEIVSFTVVENELGIYDLEVGESTGTLTVVKPAKLELDALVIAPTEVVPGESATITADTSNTGEASGTFEVSLIVNGEKSQTQEVVIAGGETGKVIFTLILETAGLYDIEIDGFDESLRVLKPAKLELDALVIAPTEVVSGESATITADASNTGEASGTFEVSLIVNGEKSQTQEVVVAGGETGKVIFTLILETAGLYDIEIDGFDESLRVLKPAEFQLSSLRISPTVAVVGQETSIKVDVLNSGEVEGTYRVTLEVNGKSVESKEVTVGSGSTVTANFVLVNDVIGNYRKAINELTGTLVVSVDKYGGQITLVSSQDITNFDEVIGGSQASALTLQMTNEELVRGDWAKGPAGTNETTWIMQPNPWEHEKGYIAESWEISEPGTIVYKIRQGIHYALNQDSEASRLVNGRELTADDVVFSLKRVISDPRAYIYGAKPTLRQALISAPDKWTVIIKVPLEVVAEAMQYFGDFVSIVPPEVVAKYGDMSDWRNSVGTGPFMLTDYINGSHAVLERNHNYWMKDPTDTGNQLPYLDSVIIAIIPDNSTRLAALRVGVIDQLSSVTEEYVALLKQTTPDLMSVKVEGNSNPALVGYNFWWPWLKNYHGELTVGYYNAIWPQYIWLHRDLKEAMGY